MNTLPERRVVRHVLFWVAVEALDVLIQLPGYVVHGTPLYLWGLVFVQLPACLLCVYPLVYWLLPRLLQRQPWAWGWLLAWLVGAHLLVTGLHSLQDHVLGPAWLGTVPRMPYVWYEDLLRVRVGYMVLLVTAGVLVAHHVFSQWRGQQVLHQQLLRQKVQTELELLKAQLQPTFLLNTLGTLHTLTTQKAPESPAAVLHLSALLRYLLYESQLATVPLAEEVELLRHYVALEQLRLGARMEVSLSFSGLLAAHGIAPLLLLPFVENAFRLVAEAAPECPWVSLDLVAKRHSLTFKVISSRPLLTPLDEAALHGVRQRLARLYPGQHELKTVTDPDSFLLVLHLRPVPAQAAVVLQPRLLLSDPTP